MIAGVGELWYGAVACLSTLGGGLLASYLMPAPAAKKTLGLMAWFDGETSE